MLLLIRTTIIVFLIAHKNDYYSLTAHPWWAVLSLCTCSRDEPLLPAPVMSSDEPLLPVLGDELWWASATCSHDELWWASATDEPLLPAPVMSCGEPLLPALVMSLCTCSCDELLLPVVLYDGRPNRSRSEWTQPFHRVLELYTVCWDHYVCHCHT